jgi:Cytochrome P450
MRAWQRKRSSSDNVSTETFPLLATRLSISPLDRTFIFAATDTTSSALSRVLHLLALHQDVQHELRCELRNATLEGDLSYDKLMSLPYLEMILKETLRVCVLWCGSQRITDCV